MKKNLNSFVLALILLVLYNCQSPSNEFDRNTFSNILDVKITPAKFNDWSIKTFYDCGAWFGFSLPDDDSLEYRGSFTGPFSVYHQKWFSKSLAKLVLVDETGSRIDLSKSELIEKKYYPGKLSQTFRINNAEIKMELIFTSARTVLVKAELKSLDNKKKHWRVGWEGKVFEESNYSVKIDDYKINLVDEKNATVMQINSDAKNNYTFSSSDKHSFQLLSEKEIIISKRRVKSSVLAFTIVQDKMDLENQQKLIDDLTVDPDEYFASNETRWNEYLTKALSTNSKYSGNKSYTEVAVKSVMTLINNWKSATGDLLHDGILPSAGVWYFDGFWAWDSWKHAVALARFAPELAKNQILTMFDYQLANGMIPDVIYINKENNNLRDSKPPLSAWAVWEIYESDGDKNFVEEMFPKILKYHEWWYKNRDNNGNGLCEYGSTDGTLEAAMWESGMDDAVRFDNAVMLKNNDQAWSVNQESVDLNSYLYSEKLYLSKMAELIGENEISLKFKDAASSLKNNILANMFSLHSGFFHDFSLTDYSHVNVFGTEGWLPLWAGIATKEQAAKVKLVMSNPEKFATFIPFPTVSKDDSLFMTGYWRGPVWLDQAYFGINGLKNYGFEKEAEEFTKQLFERPEGLMNAAGPIREQYDPRDGKGLKVNHFSWSAAAYLLLYRGE